MTDQIEDGGPAFPAQPQLEVPHGGYIVHNQGGMSLRDWFAGQALAGMGMWVPPVNIQDEDGNPIPQHMPRYQKMMEEARAKWAYAQADAMLAEREGKA